MVSKFFFFFNYTATTGIYTYGHTRSLHDALPICCRSDGGLEYLLKALARQALGYPLDPPLTEQRMLGEQLRTRVLEQLFQALCAPEAEEMSQPFPQIGFSRRAHHAFGTASRLIGIDPFRLCLAFDQKPQHLAGMPATFLRIVFPSYPLRRTHLAHTFGITP